VITKLDRGGAEQHLLRVLPELIAKEYAVTLVTMRGGGALEDEFFKKGVKVVSPNTKFPLMLQRLHSALILFWMMLRRKIDIVHFFLPEAYVIGGLVSTLTGFNCCVMSRRSLNDYQANHPVAAKIERWLHQRMRFVIGNSTAVIDQLEKEGVLKSQLKLIHNGVMQHQPCCEKISEKLKAELCVTQGALVFVIVANLIPYKGHEDLLPALWQAKNDLPDDWVLLCVGRDDGLAVDLKRSAEKYGLSDNIRWLGERNDIQEILCLSDIGLLCSHQEGFSNSLLEYMSAGLPVIATDVGGNRDAVIDLITGILVPPNFPEKLSMAITKMALDKKNRVEMGEEGKKIASGQFNIKRCIELYDSFYREAYIRHN
jgi:glycosyltransferase involved in cell wall biosynthesis